MPTLTMTPAKRLLAICAAMTLAAGCVISRTTHVDAVKLQRSDSVAVKSPLRAHLLDGSTVVFSNGMSVVRDTLVGKGVHFHPVTTQGVPRERVPLDSVVGAETLRSATNAGRTMMYSTMAAMGTVVGLVGLACAADPKCFGSCPTFYSDSGDTVVLEAEGFSYSISSLLEARDVDRLRAQPDSSGVLRLQVWNEALETHYINHLGLLETVHRPDEFVLPDPRTRPVAVSGWLRAASLTDRSGRDVSGALAAADGRLFSSDSSALRAAPGGELQDWIEIVVPRPATDSVAVVVRLRNSLLNTILFYDYMLANPGARSLDWMAEDLERLAPIAELGQWYAKRFGLRAELLVDGEWTTVARMADQGPIAWRDVAFVFPVPAGDSVRMRLSFLIDEWRIDELRVASAVRRPDTRTIALARVTDARGLPVAEARELLAGADEDYLQTMPRDRFTALFDVGRSTSPRTFLLVSQGYYTEWVRGQWMKSSVASVPFVPGDSTLRRVVQSWVAQKDSMEQQFYRSRIPVR